MSSDRPVKYLSPGQRRAAARRAFDALGARRHEHVLLRVRCASSHHVATVYGTDVGPVFVAVIGPHAHGSRDFLDLAHHAHRPGSEYADLLDADAHADDSIPARCACGTRSLSRKELRHAIDAFQRTMRIP